MNYNYLIELESHLNDEAVIYKWENPFTIEKWKRKNNWEHLPLM
jgi:hypothetical protein